MSSFADTKTAISGLLYQWEQSGAAGSRLNVGRLEQMYAQRDALFNEPKVAGVSGVLQGADAAAAEDSPYMLEEPVDPAVPA
jgi:hypothetical protein